MNKHWPTVRLAEVIHYRKEFLTIDDLTTYKRPRVQLHVRGIVLRDEVPGALIKTKTQQVCRQGDFLVAEIDAKVGGFGIVPEALDGSIVSSHYFLFVIDDSLLDRRFSISSSERQRFASRSPLRVRPTTLLSDRRMCSAIRCRCRRWWSSGEWWRGLRN